jgi:hypothetical protein
MIARAIAKRLAPIYSASINERLDFRGCSSGCAQHHTVRTRISARLPAQHLTKVPEGAPRVPAATA